ncbi:MAG: signal peptidase II [Planctomycetota bacterium]
MEESPAARRAWVHPGAHLCFWVVAIGGVALDLWSKEWAFHTLRQGGGRILIPHVLEFQTMMNDGALFGIGSGRTVLFLLASALALALVLWMFVQSSSRQWLLHIALGGILAGALGNMYDRMFVQLVPWQPPGGAKPGYFVRTDHPDQIVLREYPPTESTRTWQVPATTDLPRKVGYVRDFIKIPTKIYGERDLWPWVFNVADMLLVGGVGILAIRLWFERGHAGKRKEDLDSAVEKA